MPNTHAYKKLSYITHAYSCAFLLSLSFCRNTNTVGAFLACLKSWPLSQTMNRIYVTAAAKQFRPLDVCWFSISHNKHRPFVSECLCTGSQKTPAHTNTHTELCQGLTQKTVNGQYVESKYVCVCGKGLFRCSLTVYHSGGVFVGGTD